MLLDVTSLWKRKGLGRAPGPLTCVTYSIGEDYRPLSDNILNNHSFPRFHVSFRYTTITVGVDPGYVKENFYDKVLKKDSGRVNSRFSAAESKGMLVEERSVAQEEIVSHLQRTGPVILLTNANLLSCTKCSNYISCYPSCFSSVAYQV